MIPRIAVQLLDSAQGHPLQTWTFENRDMVTLGRAPECDVMVADPYVSRSHAYLKFDGGKWRLVSVSQRLVVFEGQTWTEVPLTDGTVFWLGPNGCYLRFAQATAQYANSATISFNSPVAPVFQLDRERMQDEVSQIVDAQYFQQLKDASRQLRERRNQPCRTSGDL